MGKIFYSHQLLLRVLKYLINITLQTECNKSVYKSTKITFKQNKTVNTPVNKQDNEKKRDVQVLEGI